MDIIRAWKDAEYRNSLSEAERAALPPNPAGIVELPDDDMHIARGGDWHTNNLVNSCGQPGHLCQLK
jgi:mersacidin/lichenicidin family type 2 lantibiotic